MPVPNTHSLEKNSPLYHNVPQWEYPRLFSDLIKFSVNYIPKVFLFHIIFPIKRHKHSENIFHSVEINKRQQVNSKHEKAALQSTKIHLEIFLMLVWNW